MFIREERLVMWVFYAKKTLVFKSSTSVPTNWATWLAVVLEAVIVRRAVAVTDQPVLTGAVGARISFSRRMRTRRRKDSRSSSRDRGVGHTVAVLAINVFRLAGYQHAISRGANRWRCLYFRCEC